MKQYEFNAMATAETLPKLSVQFTQQEPFVCANQLFHCNTFTASEIILVRQPIYKQSIYGQNRFHWFITAHKHHERLNATQYITNHSQSEVCAVLTRNTLHRLSRLRKTKNTTCTFTIFAMLRHIMVGYYLWNFRDLSYNINVSQLSLSLMLLDVS